MHWDCDALLALHKLHVDGMTHALLSQRYDLSKSGIAVRMKKATFLASLLEDQRRNPFFLLRCSTRKCMESMNMNTVGAIRDMLELGMYPVCLGRGRIQELRYWLKTFNAKGS